MDWFILTDSHEMGISDSSTHHLEKKKVNVGPDLISRRIIRKKRKENFKMEDISYRRIDKCAC